jgi:hypothetical protein
MPHPNRVDAYAEIGEDTVVKSMKDTKGRWVAFGGLHFLKAVCQYHPEEGLWFCLFLRREEEVKAEEALPVKRANEFVDISQQREVEMTENGLSLLQPSSSIALSNNTSQVLIPYAFRSSFPAVNLPSKSAWALEVSANGYTLCTVPLILSLRMNSNNSFADPTNSSLVWMYPRHK